jgi:hypothetical protein
MLRQHYAMMTSWPRANALVVASQVAEGRDSKGNRSYWPRVTLKYSVAGKEYVQVAERPGASSGSRSGAQEVVDGLQPGTHHLLPYNPDNPGKIYVDIGWNFSNFGFFGVFLLAGVVSMLPFLWSLFKFVVGVGLVAYQRLKS